MDATATASLGELPAFPWAGVFAMSLVISAFVTLVARVAWVRDRFLKDLSHPTVLASGAAADQREQHAGGGGVRAGSQLRADMHRVRGNNHLAK